MAERLAYRESFKQMRALKLREREARKESFLVEQAIYNGILPEVDDEVRRVVNSSSSRAHFTVTLEREAEYVVSDDFALICVKTVEHLDTLISQLRENSEILNDINKALRKWIKKLGKTQAYEAWAIRARQHYDFSDWKLSEIHIPGEEVTTDYTWHLLGFLFLALVIFIVVFLC